MSTSYILIGFLQWSLANVFIMLFSLLLWTNLRLCRPHINYCILLFYFLLNVSLFVLVMGLTGLLERNVVTGVSIAGLVLLLRFFYKPIALSVETMKNDLKHIFQKCVHHPYLAAIFGVVVLVIGFRMMAHIWILSPYIWDTLAYQLPKVADWIQYQKLVVVPTVETRSFWPANFELFQTWFVLFFHHDFLIEAAGLPFYLLAILSVYSIARTLHLSRTWSTFSAFLFALTPAVFMNAVSCKNDIAIASLYLFILAIILNYRRDNGHVIEPIVLVVAAIALGIGIKATMIFILPGLCLIGLWCFWRRSEHSLGNNLRNNVLVTGAFVLSSSIFLGIYWYARNYLMFGNPFYPTDFRMLGYLVFGDGYGQGQQGAFKWDSMLISFQALIQNKILDRSEPYTADLGGMSGWGWFVFSFGLPACLWALRINSEYRWLAAGFFVSLSFLFGFVSPDPWNMRFAYWFPSLIVIGYIIVTSHMRVKLLRSIAVVTAIMCSVLNLIACMSTGYTKPQEWKARAAISVWDRTIIHGNVAMDIYKIPAGEKFAYFTRPNAWVYPLYGPDYSRKISYLQLRRDMDIVSEMKIAGVRFLLLFEVDKEWLEYLDLKVSQGQMKRVTDHLYCLAETEFKTLTFLLQ